MKKSHLGLSVLATALSAPLALGAGFEKNITFSGKNAGKAGTAVADTSGAEALYFNPAGLGGAKGIQISANFSPTWGHYEGPVRAIPDGSTTSVTFGGASATDTETGDTMMSPVFGALASYGLTDSLSVGAGVYVSGGSKAMYENVQMKSVAGPNLFEKTTIKTDLSIVEYALGVGYTVMPGLKLGAAVRMVNVAGDFWALTGTGATSQAVVKLSDMKKSELGYKFGAQYEGSGWGVGASYRLATDFTAEGTLAVRYQTTTSASDLAVSNGGAATLASTLPQQIVLGGYYDVMSDLRLLGQVDWTEYSKNRQLSYTGKFTLGTEQDLSTKPTALQWANQSVYRLGGEYAGWSFAKIRAGYAYTTQVTNSGFASATLAAPGTANTFTLGLGKSFGEGIEANLAVESSKTTGTGTGAKAGDYAVAGTIAHLGFNYSF
jgi:long-subunit fatty acid transport protein